MEHGSGSSRWKAFVQDHRFEEMIYVMRPALPPLEQFQERLKPIWERGFLTNNGPVKQEFEAALAKYLGVQEISLFANGTLALLLALKALDLPAGGEVITTPFTFPATVHVLDWLGLKPVFCDIDAQSGALDPQAAAKRITPRSCAILPVHLYGFPCDVDALAALAKNHDLALVYDAAHCFGARYRGRALSAYGDAGMLSFHATKLFSTIEGGAVVTPKADLKSAMDQWKNFGITGYESVVVPGLNAKMNEVQAAYGLLMLENIDQEIADRAAVSATYRRVLADIPGITLPPRFTGLDPNHAYFPIRMNATRYGVHRDQVFEAMQALNVLPRKYFSPLATEYAWYADKEEAQSADAFPIAQRTSEEVLCLPIYGKLPLEHVERIGAILHALPELIAS